MASEPAARNAQVVGAEEEDEGFGGPVKTFLEHLEDLRWTLVKSVSALLLAMLVCLVAGNQLVKLLSWPLSHALTFGPKIRATPVQLGTNVIGRVNLRDLGPVPWQTNEVRALRVVPLTIGTNTFLAFEPELRAPREDDRLVVLKNYTPIEGIMVAFKLALYGGLVLAAPFVFFFVGQFVLPALKVTEKAILYRAVGYGTVLFFLGVLCCYFLVAGVALTATVQFSNWMGFIADEWRADAYIGFMCKFMLGMGLTFELPVVILTLVKIELLDLAKLRSFRPYAIIGNLVIAAVVTPSGDPFTMVLMAFPLQLLYELSVAVAWYWEWRTRRSGATGTPQPT
jgi:sec-independent protein translocase protein TatC